MSLSRLLPPERRAVFMARLALAVGRPRRAEAWLTWLLTGHAKGRKAPPAAAPAAQALALRSVLRQARGARQLALVDARALVAAHPQRAGADWYNLGFLLETSGAFDEAAAAFTRAVALAPQLDQAWYGLGLARLRAGQLEEAVAPLTECTRLQPMSPHAWYQLARLNAERGQFDEARRLTEHLAGFEPGVAERLRGELGWALQMPAAPLPSSGGQTLAATR